MSRPQVHRGEAPLIVAFPHTGTDIPAEIAFASPWLARKDADWWIDRLYDFAAGLGATTIRTGISRSVIDVNRDPSGASLYPGQATTELCPTTTFDGEPLQNPDADEIARRRTAYFDPYHAAIEAEIARLRAIHPGSSSTTPIRSAAMCRDCSRASCRSSTSAPMAARPAPLPCARPWKPPAPRRPGAR